MPESTHACPARCGTSVPAHRFACPTDWARLPAELKATVYDTWTARRANPRAHRAAMTAAIAWYRTNPRRPADTP